MTTETDHATEDTQEPQETRTQRRQGIRDAKEEEARLKAEEEANAALPDFKGTPQYATEPSITGSSGGDAAQSPESEEAPSSGQQEADPTMPIGGRRTNAGGEAQTQMDEVVLDAEEHAEVLINLQALERLHEAKMLYDRSHREAWTAFVELGKGDGKARAYRLRDFRIIWPDITGEATPISFWREPTQKVSVTRIKD